MGRRKKLPALSTDPRFYLEWFSMHKRIAPDDPVAFGWLPNTMSIEELLAIRVAAEKIGAEVRINRRGGGEVILPMKAKESV